MVLGTLPRTAIEHRVTFKKVAAPLPLSISENTGK